MMKKLFNPVLIVAFFILSGCASTQYPETPHRAKLIQEITQKSGMVRTVANSSHKEKTEKEIIESSRSATSERKQKIATHLPPDYWSKYEKNLIIFSSELNKTTEKSLSEYIEKYSKELSRATDEELEILANSSEMENTPTFKKVMKRDNYLTIHYFQSSNKFQLQAVSNHLSRMAKLDKEYNVCSLYEDCWK